MVLSIIVPVYNVEPYLRRCLDSLLSQDLPPEDYEIILVDDGSLDDCPEICDEYANKYDSIRVIHRDNGGLSAARNSGVGIARGKYIQFVDADDFLESNVLQSLVDIAERNCLDVLRFNYQNVNEQDEIIHVNRKTQRFSDYSESVTDGTFFLTSRLGFACYAPQFIIRRDLLKDCTFKEGIYFEDTEWTPRMLLKASHVASTPMVVYNYRVRQGSITKSIDKERKIKCVEDRMSLIGSLNEQKQRVEDKRWFEGMISQMSLAIIADVSKNLFDKRKYYINGLKGKCVFPLSSYHATAAASRKIRLANISPMLFCILLHLKNKGQ